MVNTIDENILHSIFQINLRYIGLHIETNRILPSKLVLNLGFMTQIQKTA